jgi:hypothetical protein
MGYHCDFSLLEFCILAQLRNKHAIFLLSLSVLGINENIIWIQSECN